MFIHSLNTNFGTSIFEPVAMALAEPNFRLVDRQAIAGNTISETAKLIKELLLDKVRNKIEKYAPETDYRPFHYGLLGRDRYAVFAFIQSMNTTFGMSIWEQTAKIISESYSFNSERQYSLLGSIDSETEVVISGILHRLRKGQADAEVSNEKQEIRASIKNGLEENDPDSRVDFYLEKGDQENYFDITSVKPNMKEFVALKRKLLRWTALRLSIDKDANVRARLAIPYNPYHPDAYDRWTLKGLFDLDAREVLVGEDFWNFCADGKVYDDLVDVFNEAGEILRPELDAKFESFRQN